MKNIAILLNSFGPGGAGRLVARVVQGVDRSRFRVSVAAFAVDTAYCTRLGMSVSSLAIPPYADYPVRAVSVRAYLEETSPDLVVAVVAYPSPHLTGPALELGIPATVFVTTDLEEHLALLTHDMPETVCVEYGVAARNYLQSVDGVMTHGRRVAQKLEATYGRHVCALLPNMPEARSSASAPHRVESPRVVLSIGRLGPEKGHEFLIRALAKVPEVQLRILGGGPERDRCTGVARDLGLADRVRIEPFLSDEQAREAMATSSLFVLPSLYETMPAVVLDAMDAGVPIVATDVGELPDLLSKLYPCVPARDEHRLAGAIEDVLSRDNESAIRAARVIAEGHSAEKVMPLWESVFDTFAGVRSHREAVRGADMRSLAEILVDSFKPDGGFDLYGGGYLAEELILVAKRRDVAMHDRFDRTTTPSAKDISNRDPRSSRPLVVASMFYVEIMNRLRTLGIRGPIYRYARHA
jgi:glycosyltransferase involved in cell wall biosynthesis